MNVLDAELVAVTVFPAGNDASARERGWLGTDEPVDLTVITSYCDRGPPISNGEAGRSSPSGRCSHPPVRRSRPTGVLHALDEPARALAEFYRVLEPGGTAWISDPAILDVPEDPDIELTAHEREVFRVYGVRSVDEERPLSTDEARRLAAESPFEDATVEVGEPGDVRLTLSRRE